MYQCSPEARISNESDVAVVEQQQQFSSGGQNSQLVLL